MYNLLRLYDKVRCFVCLSKIEIAHVQIYLFQTMMFKIRKKERKMHPLWFKALI
jgi:hypothetical protein